MKKSFFTFVFIVFCAYGAVAQFEQGRILAGGAFGLSFDNDKGVYDGVTQWEYKTTTLSLSPRAGFFVADGLAVGAGLEFGSSTFKSGDYKETTTAFGLSPFVRYYLPQGIFGQAEVGFGSGKYEGEGEDKQKFFLWSVGAGYAIFLNDNVAVEPMVSYKANTITNSDDTNAKEKNNTILLSVGFSIYLGK